MALDGLKLVDSSATFHQDMAGALCYMTSGNNAGLCREIAGRAGDGDYPTLQVADGEFSATHADPALPHTTAVSTLSDLNNMRNNLAGNYYLTNNIDATDTINWDSGRGWLPIGIGHPTHSEFTGTFDGCGYTISNLYCAQGADTKGDGSDSEYYLGLFGATIDSKIANVTLENCTLIGSEECGPIVGQLYGGGVYNCHASGTITAEGNGGYSYEMGGLIGWAENTDLESCYIYDCTTSVTITVNAIDPYAAEFTGGFIGEVSGSVYIENCRATGNVIANSYDDASQGDSIGGFVGYVGGGDQNTTFLDCAATGNVTGDDFLGGFGGQMDGVYRIERCSARGNVTFNGVIGGGLGVTGGGFAATIGTQILKDCYAWGNVDSSAESSAPYLGSFSYLLSIKDDNPTFIPFDVDNIYAIGLCTQTEDIFGDLYVGGLFGYAGHATISEGGVVGQTNSGGTIDNCFFDLQTTLLASSFIFPFEGEVFWYRYRAFVLGQWVNFDSPTLTNCSGQNTQWMKTQSNYEAAGWDFDTVWEMDQSWVDAAITPTSIEFVERFPYEIESGDTYCISGVKFGARLWPLQDGSVSKFNRWNMVGGALKCRKLSGFTGNDNNFWRLSVYRGVKKELETEGEYIDVDTNPADSAGALSVDGVDLEPYVEQIAAGVKFELTDAEFNVAWTDSREVTNEGR